MADFYIFNSRNYLTTFWASSDIRLEALAQGDGDKAWALDRALDRGEYDGFEFPIVWRENKLNSGKRMRDVLDNRTVGPYLISDRMRDLLVDNDVTGWKCYPIELYDKKGNRIDGYNGFSVTGRCGSALEYKRDTLVQFQGDWMWKGAIFDLDAWDGSDIFFVGGHYIITARVARLFKKHKISAIELIRLTDELDWLHSPEK